MTLNLGKKISILLVHRIISNSVREFFHLKMEFIKLHLSKKRRFCKPSVCVCVLCMWERERDSYQTLHKCSRSTILVSEHPALSESKWLKWKEKSVFLWQSNIVPNTFHWPNLDCSLEQTEVECFAVTSWKYLPGHECSSLYFQGQIFLSDMNDLVFKPQNNLCSFLGCLWTGLWSLVLELYAPSAA